MTVEKTSHRDLQHQITVVHVVAGGTCREILTGFVGKSDIVLGWKASRGYTYHEHSCEIYMYLMLHYYLSCAL